uniref:Uncharacterized protein n=1 Tax=Rhodnius prolixus TaxID=13249 RepID=T1I522_RHOPR
MYTILTLLLCYIAVPTTICTISDELAFEGPSTYDAEPSLIDLNNPFGFFFEKLKIMAQPKEMWPIGLCNCEAENNLLAERLLKRLGSGENGESSRLEHVELKIDENFGKTKKGMIKQGTNKTLKDEL